MPGRDLLFQVARAKKWRAGAGRRSHGRRGALRGRPPLSRGVARGVSGLRDIEKGDKKRRPRIAPGPPFFKVLKDCSRRSILRVFLGRVLLGEEAEAVAQDIAELGGGALIVGKIGRASCRERV